MGASSSSRRLTVRNDEPHIIEVTNDVINRLRSGAPKATAAYIETPPQPQPPPPQPTPQPPPPQPSSQVPAPVMEPENVSSMMMRNPNPISDPLALSITATGQQILETVSAIKVRELKDEELKQNDNLWRTKLKELETRYVNSAFASDQEFNSELDKLEKLLPKKKEPICRDLSIKVSACYNIHPTQSLKCSDIVQAFKECVQKSTTYTL